MTDWNCGCVITAGAGRLDNLRRTLALADKTSASEIVVVLDGKDAWPFANELSWSRAMFVFSEKHRPGMEQPRNLGARALPRETAQVWFLDSDLVFDTGIVDLYAIAYSYAEPRVLIGPYDWMAQGETELDGRLEMPDPRWPSFRQHEPEEVVRDDLSAGLACFGGNLVWPRDQFERIGGFHPRLSHGRVEDGELGLRAVAHGVPMSFVSACRAAHVWHPRDMQWILGTNTREVPIVNELHPWLAGRGIYPVEKDGVRFDFECPECHESVNTGEYWLHMESHAG